MHPPFDFIWRAVATPLCLTLLVAAPLSTHTHAAATSSRVIPNSLLSVDMNRSAVIDRVLASWNTELPKAQIASFTAQLNALRADELLAASLAGSFDGVLEIMQASQRASGATVDRSKALGEVDRDLVYTPISPCRFIETRTVYANFGIPYYGAGQFAAGEIRNYVVGSACGLPAGVTALQAQVQGQATAGFGANLEATKGGGPFGGGLTLIAANSPLFTVVSAAVPLNLGTNSIGIQVTVATADVVMDVVGYFMPASRNGDGLRVIGGGTSTPSVVNGDNSNTTGVTTGTTISGGYNNTISANNAVISGGYGNTASGFQATIAGGAGQLASNNASTIGGGGANTSSGNHSTVAGGLRNTASGDFSHIGGGQDNLASGTSANVSGGVGNKATAVSSTVGGGGHGPNSNCYDHLLQTNTAPCWNEANGTTSTVAGGSNNRAAAQAFVGGGEQNRANGNGSVIGGGYANRAGTSAFVGSGYGHAADGPGSVIGGGFRNTVTGNNSSIVGGGGGINSGISSFVGNGGSGNASNCYNHQTGLTDVNCWNEIGAQGNSATIVGGYNNRTNNFTAFIGGGASNSVTQNEGVIVGGAGNLVSNYSAFIGGGNRNTASGGSASVVGGSQNLASGGSSVVSGGFGNQATGSSSTVGGGGQGTASTCYNNASDASPNPGDQPCYNRASGLNSTVSGGANNQATQPDASIGGGYQNRATSGGSRVSGGYSNVASGYTSVVGGGARNLSSANQSTVPGGLYNAATGAFTFAAGRGATTNTGGATPTHHQGTFVWSDSPGDNTPAATQPFRSTADNQFAVRARGGVSFKVGGPAIADPANVGYISNAADATPGCSLPAGGAASWSCTSDRNTKEAIRAISPKAILAKVSALPLSTWQFKGTERRHMSPMAQDFWAAFGLGVNDKAITSSDVSGVALGAIQGLNQKLSEQLKQKDAEIANLKRDMAAIKKKLAL